jgi:erythromycin esterase-like protein
MTYKTILLTCVVASGCAAARGRDAELEPITTLACRNDIVLLGELPTHGEAKAFALKGRIVQALVEECGFDALLFEAPIYDFVGLAEAIEQRRSEPVQLNNAIGRFWLGSELAPFRSWLYQRATTDELMVGGLDDQISATAAYARSRLPELMTAECKDPVLRHVNWTYNDTQPFDAAEKQRLQRCARSAAKANDVLLRNFADYVDRQVQSSTARTRDEVMYDNLRWYVSQLPQGSKVVVWTATVHAARTQGNIAFKPLGAQLVDAGFRVASIGFTALTGETAMAGRSPRKLEELPDNSLEAQTRFGEIGWAYLDAARLARMGAVPARLLGKTTPAEWDDYFDGVVVIREEVAPTPENR